MSTGLGRRSGWLGRSYSFASASTVAAAHRCHVWLTQADVDENGSATELTSKEKKELIELRRDKRRLEMEVEILKRAAAYFARENVLPN
jgi:transposase-like protein